MCLGEVLYIKQAGLNLSIQLVAMTLFDLILLGYFLQRISFLMSGSLSLEDNSLEFRRGFFDKFNKISIENIKFSDVEQISTLRVTTWYIRIDYLEKGELRRANIGGYRLDDMEGMNQLIQVQKKKKVFTVVSDYF